MVLARCVSWRRGRAQPIENVGYDCTASKIHSKRRKSVSLEMDRPDLGGRKPRVECLATEILRIHESRPLQDATASFEELVEAFGLTMMPPFVVKPILEDNSRGISLVTRGLLREAKKHTPGILRLFLGAFVLSKLRFRGVMNWATTLLTILWPGFFSNLAFRRIRIFEGTECRFHGIREKDRNTV